MSTPKHTKEFLKKRQLMVFALLPIVLCTTALFALGGGGRGLLLPPTRLALVASTYRYPRLVRPRCLPISCRRRQPHRVAIGTTI
jgi:hypothetical protein